ncbi:MULTISPECIES: endonuclease/exonuclease/phosphatase family protein [unclassified Ruegeria]|uniref:endonuclease/exonuclease/phosphatase family protein n=1 Tax=unclassified Ruegeria TaxID=2625375 RepID=UPI0014879FF8|nr:MULTISPECIES: endonuclease/exonuclease/phosphatase family protein [unclassified Ruegeria]
MIRILFLLVLPLMAQAETVRVATFNTELSRDGPGLLLRDIRRGDAQVQAVVQVLTAVNPDIVALQGVDWDFGGETLAALTEQLREAGLDYPHQFAARPNSGLETGLDMDGDGRTHGPGDAQGWGKYTGHGGMAVLSRYPINQYEVQDFSPLLWRDLPDAQLPVLDGQLYPSEDAQMVQRLPSVAQWVVPVDTPFGPVDLMTFHAAPPVFDGPEDRNGLRNHDEIQVWSHVLEGRLGSAPKGPYVIAGDANQDPTRREGRKQAIKALLSHPLLQDPQPRDATGDLATVTWKATGDMRVDCVLPSAHWTVRDSGVYWPDTGTEGRTAAQTASRHRLVWVDLELE